MTIQRRAAETLALARALHHAETYLAAHDDARVSPAASLGDLRSRLCGPLPDDGAAAAEVVDDLVRSTQDGLLRSGGGRSFAWVIGGAVPAAVAAEWLVAAWDQNAALFESAPAAAVVEEACGAWLKELLGLPPKAAFALVSGAQMASFSALAAARNALLRRAGWDVEARGLTGAPAIRILCSGEHHGSIDRAARLLGLGRDALVSLGSDELGRVLIEPLRRELASDAAAPTIVVLQAGQINTGAYDAFETIVPLARRSGAWVHVDGAFGLWAAVSDRYRHHLKGVELADSWVVDGHKWLNVPQDSGYAFVADPEPLRRAMSHRESYLAYSDQARDPMDWNPDWSRRARGFATWAAIRQLGRRGIAALVERTCDQAAELVERLAAIPAVEIVCSPQINQGLVRFLTADPDPGAPAHDRRTDDVIAALVADGTAFFQGTGWRGRRCMRVSVSSWRTTAADLERTVEAVRRCLRAVSGIAGRDESRDRIQR